MVIMHRSDWPYKTGNGFQGWFLVRGAFQAMQIRANLPKQG